jgi:hypothetical protein
VPASGNGSADKDSQAILLPFVVLGFVSTAFCEGPNVPETLHVAARPSIQFQLPAPLANDKHVTVPVPKTSQFAPLASFDEASQTICRKATINSGRVLG